METEITISVEQLQKKLGQNIKLKYALERGALVVENHAKENCPVGETGELRRSITHEVDTDKNQAEIGTPLSYAPFCEYGTGLFAEAGDGRKDVPWHYQDAKGEWHSTSGQEPNPYLRPALNDNYSEIKKQVMEGLKKDLINHFKGTV